MVLAPDIEDHKDNETRFVFLARQRERQDWFEPYKTSVVCEIVKDQPGALLLILQEFAFRRINLTKIESRPSKRRLGDYIFLVDMEGKVDDGPVADALRCLCCKLPRLDGPGQLSCGQAAKSRWGMRHRAEPRRGRGCRTVNRFVSRGEYRCSTSS